MFNDVKDFYRLFYVANLRLFRDDEVNVNVGVNEVPVGAALNSPSDPHEAVFLNNEEQASYSVHGGTVSKFTFLMSPIPTQPSPP